MEKDIDDLLDEVESKYVTKNQKAAKKPPPVVNSSHNAASAIKPKSRFDDDISDILDLDVDNPCSDSLDGRPAFSPTRITKTPSVRSSVSGENSHNPKRPCLPAFLSGSSTCLGRGSSVSKLACDQLRCTSCDFRVCFFDNLAWSKDTDYLFLRNNVPDLQKLKAKLVRKKGMRAYCCQCSWRSVQDLIEISDPSLKWVCGKHES